MFGLMMSPDLPNQMYAESVRIGQQERLVPRVAREWKAARRLARQTARLRPVVQPAEGSPSTTSRSVRQRAFLHGHLRERISS
jgi:hypothetical protein